MLILVVDLIAKFQYALDNKWGYIMNTAGELLTQEKQNRATSDMTRQYGQQWVGRYVSDCSGLFYWAFKKLGGYMYHGSNTMWNKYCTAQGKLSGGRRTDGQEIKPGTAVFVLKGTSDRSHVGLYIGNGEVIEAAGTKSGVIKSKVTNKKWAEWGELKGVDYSGESSGDTPEPTPAQDDTSATTAVVNAAKVALRAGPSTSDKVLTRVNKGERVTVLGESWTKIIYQGKTGYMMTKFLD